MELSLTEREVDYLGRILAESLPQLREEIHKTDSYDFRESLKKDEEVLKELIAKIHALRNLNTA